MTRRRSVIRTALVLTAGAVAVAAPAGAATVPPSDPANAVSVPTSGAPANPTVDAAYAAVSAQIAIGAETVYEDEDSLKFGECPLVTPAEVTALVGLVGADSPFEISPAEYETLNTDEGQPIEALGFYCDLDADDDAAEGGPTESGLVSAFDLNNQTVIDALPVLIGGATAVPGPAAIGGETFFSCSGDEGDDEQECSSLWLGTDLGIAVQLDVATTVDTAAFEAGAPAVIETVITNLATPAAA